MKILHVLSAPRAQGTPRLVLDWKNDKNLDQTVLFIFKHDILIQNEFERSFKKIKYLNVPSKGVKKFYQIIWKTNNIVSKGKYDVLIAWPTGLSLWIILGGWLGGVRRIIIHAGNPPASKGIFQRYIYSWLTFWNARFLNAKVICCSNYVRKSYLSIPLMPENIFSTIYNCFNPDRFKFKNYIKRSSKKAIMVATLEPHKDHKTLLKSWRIVEKVEKNYELIIAGDGSLLKELQIMAANLGLMLVTFSGSSVNIPELLYQSTIFILSTTESEGFGTVLIEALVSGNFVIATDVPACREVLMNGEFGILVPSKNPEALAKAILRAFVTLLSEEQKRKNIEYASSFTPERMIEGYLKIVGLDMQNKSDLKDENRLKMWNRVR